MESKNIGQIIKDIRKKNNLTQAEFAEMFNVTYQAVSKWENGKNIPDILILRDISKQFNIDMNELFDTNKTRKNQSLIMRIMIIISIIILISISIFFFINQNTSNDNFQFMTLSSGCDNFTILGSIAYSDRQSHIYISRIEYCSEADPTLFSRIE